MQYVCESFDKVRCCGCIAGKPHKPDRHCNTYRTCSNALGNKVRCIPVECIAPDYLFRIDGMSSKTERMFYLLEEMFLKCARCEIHKNGRATPFWTTSYNDMAIVGEAPGLNEVQSDTPFCGTSGKILMDTLEKYQIKREECLIINTVNCRPMDGLKNGKPSAMNIESCRIWIRKYFGVLKPKKVLLLGSYALGTMFNESNTTSRNATMSEVDGIKYVKSVHPAYALYNRNTGLQMIEKSVELFKEI